MITKSKGPNNNRGQTTVSALLRLARQTTPSGTQVDTAYWLDGRPVEIRVNGAVLISNIVYQPFGQPKSWTWGNGTVP